MVQCLGTGCPDGTSTEQPAAVTRLRLVWHQPIYGEWESVAIQGVGRRCICRLLKQKKNTDKGVSGPQSNWVAPTASPTLTVASQQEGSWFESWWYEGHEGHWGSFWVELGVPLLYIWVFYGSKYIHIGVGLIGDSKLTVGVNGFQLFDTVHRAAWEAVVYSRRQESLMKPP